jgi:hypothetical protein
MIDRRRSAPLQLENAEKLESGQVEEGQVGACRCGAGQVRRADAGQVGARASQGEASLGEAGSGRGRVQNEKRSLERSVDLTNTANGTSDGAAFYLANLLMSDSHNADQLEAHKCLMSRISGLVLRF